MLTAQEALACILTGIQPLGKITVNFEHALGCVLAENIIADEHIPPFDNSAMDGFAVYADDTTDESLMLRIVEDIPAGYVSTKVLQRGEAMSIMTGAPIPSGCDSVIQVEWIERIDTEHIQPTRSVNRGHNIRKAGKDAQKGTVVLPTGTLIRPQEVGILASLGKQFVTVVRPPSVALLSTGDELLDMNKPLSPGKIRNSNLFVLKALLRQVGCEVIDLGISRDTKSELILKIEQGLKADVLITSGGISVGSYDYVLDVCNSLGIEQQFWKVNIKPGMPIMFGKFKEKLVFALPGNPVSTYVTFTQFVKPALLALKGERSFSPVRVQAIVKEEITKTDGKRHYIRGILEFEDNTFTVRSTGAQVSNLLSSLSKANCLIIVPENIESVHVGDAIMVELL